MPSPDLSTTYLGLELANPIVVGANPLTSTLDGIRKCAVAGAGAIVLKSLFEEEIRSEAEGVDNALELEGAWHPEVYDYLRAELGMRCAPRQYLELIGDARRETGIPIIASINCVSPDVWPEFAAETAAAGASALELNIALFPDDIQEDASRIEQRVLDIVAAATRAVAIPVAVKLSPYFSALPNLVLRVRQAGAKGCVLFNRLYRPTIHPETLKVIGGDRFSNPAESALAIRWIALLAGRIDLDFAAATGFHDGSHAVRAILAGARAIQTVSALHRGGLDQIAAIHTEIRTWMTRKGFSTIADFRGLVSQARQPESPLFTRLQYMRRLDGA
jgi:dihydroorotate dehydrogenase (fumarate)